MATTTTTTSSTTSSTSTTTSTTTTSPGDSSLQCTGALYDLTSQIQIFSYTNNGNEVLVCQGLVAFGNGVNDLDGTGGDFEFTLAFGGVPVQPDPQLLYFGEVETARTFTEQFPLPVGVTVTFKVKSPNAADSNVWVNACLYEVSVESIRDEIDDIQDSLADISAAIASLTAAQRLQLNVYDGTGEPGSGVYPT